MNTRNNWYRVKILGSKESTEHEATWQAFNDAGITSKSKTHAMRGAGVRTAEMHGVSKKSPEMSLPSPFLDVTVAANITLALAVCNRLAARVP